MEQKSAPPRGDLDQRLTVALAGIAGCGVLDDAVIIQRKKTSRLNELFGTGVFPKAYTHCL
ncbi:MAG: hypothetical protein ABR508_09295 [Candidatus Baltobacteraceae bacterium]